MGRSKTRVLYWNNTPSPYMVVQCGCPAEVNVDIDVASPRKVCGLSQRAPAAVNTGTGEQELGC
jgi:hypothetical protein